MSGRCCGACPLRLSSCVVGTRAPPACPNLLGACWRPHAYLGWRRVAAGDVRCAGACAAAALACVRLSHFGL